MLVTINHHNHEITIRHNGKIVAQMVDYRDLGMGIAPHKLNGISELQAVAIILNAGV